MSEENVGFDNSVIPPIFYYNLLIICQFYGLLSCYRLKWSYIVGQFGSEVKVYSVV